MKGIDYFYANLGVKLEPEFEISETPQDVFCVCCGRPSSEWPSPSSCVIGESYGKKEIHCLSCQSLYHGSFKKLGHEGFRGSNPTALKLGMLKGCGALVTAEHSILYAPKKYFPKFKDAEAPIFDEILDMGGSGILLDAIARRPAPPFLFIQNFGVKKADLVNHLFVTNSSDTITVCMETDHYDLPLTFVTLKESLEKLSSKERDSWSSLFRRSCSQYLKKTDLLELHDLTNKAEGLSELLKELPADPHLRTKIIRLAGV